MCRAQKKQEGSTSIEVLASTQPSLDEMDFQRFEEIPLSPSSRFYHCLIRDDADITKNSFQCTEMKFLCGIGHKIRSILRVIGRTIVLEHKY
jgi:hypothetical protein